MNVVSQRTEGFARQVLIEELGDDAAGVTLALGPAALSAAEQLLPHPRESWALPTDAWERLVVAVAVTVRRLEGARRMPRPAVREAVRKALKEIATGRPAA